MIRIYPLSVLRNFAGLNIPLKWFFVLHVQRSRIHDGIASARLNINYVMRNGRREREKGLRGREKDREQER
jgi:hypothetical protein